MKQIIYILLISFLFACGAKSKAYTWQRYGITFTCPAGWKITDQEDQEGGAYYLAIEKQGWDASGLITVVIFEDSLDQTEVLNVYEEALKENFILKRGDMNFDMEKDSVFNIYPSRAREYDVTLLSVKMEGVMHCFHICNQTIYFLKQTAVDDYLVNGEGFDVFEKSFTCTK